jgi:hypothetical protein
VPTEPETPTIAQVVHRAAQVCDPEGGDEGVAQLLAEFEDRDEPITSIADVETEVLEAKGAIDPESEDPGVTMAAAVAVYLAYRRTELEDDREEILRLAARAEFGGGPPPPVAGWLAAEGVTL